MEFAALRTSVISELNRTNVSILEELKLAEDEGLMIKELAESLGMSKGHISDQVSKLEEFDLVVKKETEEGRQLVYLGEEFRFLEASDFHR